MVQQVFNGLHTAFAQRFPVARPDAFDQLYRRREINHALRCYQAALGSGIRLKLDAHWASAYIHVDR